jgi:glutamate racemase
VENGGPGSPGVAAALDGALAGLPCRAGDLVVLGCTHYTHVRAEIAARLHPGVDLVDTDAPVARQAARVYASVAAPPGSGATKFLTSGDADRVSAAMSRLWGRPVVAAPLPRGD